MEGKKRIVFIIHKNYSFTLFRFTSTLWSWFSQLNMLLFPFLKSNSLLPTPNYVEGEEGKEGWGESGLRWNSPVTVKFMGFLFVSVRVQSEKRSQYEMISISITNLIYNSSISVCVSVSMSLYLYISIKRRDTLQWIGLCNCPKSIGKTIRKSRL